ncbi:MAG: hypothetical protein OXD29_11165 [Roseovarius sp.]|nr:hypothetical protein [Roseovarius sp.]MCY4208494.1 hypothetical protein [Roseovarius sp.]MCY4292910.1 hypothetical protein [Roseovarius sp.]
MGPLEVVLGDATDCRRLRRRIVQIRMIAIETRDSPGTKEPEKGKSNGRYRNLQEDGSSRQQVTWRDLPCGGHRRCG